VGIDAQDVGQRHEPWPPPPDEPPPDEPPPDELLPIDDEGLSARIGADHLGHSHVSMTQDRYLTRGRIHTQVAACWIVRSA
jgi:hypothetical protein